jgi:endoglucanase
VGALFETHRLSWAAASAPTLGWKAIHAARSVRLYLQADPSVGGILLATLPGNATSYQFQKLTPGVTAFIRIEAETAGGVVSQNLSIQTPGGPGAVLDSPVREIHAYAPDILRVVLSGGNGSTWQAGPWSITRANGAKIAVREVHRESIPVGGPDYQVGYGRPYRDDVLDIEHRIYLVLAEPIGNIEILNIHGPKSIDLMLPFNDRFLETPVIQLNQVGYDPHATQRFAYVSGWMGDGGTLPLTNFPTEAEVLEDNGSRATVVAAVPVTTRSKFDPEVGGEVRQIDLSAVAPSEGRRLRVRLPGVGISWPTSVGESAISQTFSILARGLFLNRWGGDLKPRFTEWSRPADYHAVYTGELADFKQMYPASMPRTGERRVTAGYHDAGDFEQRPMSTVVAQLLMRAFELGSHSFADGQLNIPESGNGIPDLLDEALWGVSFWEQLQESDGGVRQGVQSHRHPWGFYLASDDPLPYWTFSRDANVTARAAGLFAQAARLVSP